ncbi:efflux RND transporter permease subunit [Roseovarius ramblicola]|uniref:Efflux RND transporter permease subunit n=1 Tax=Roseovarius ramblicola TaxID=2022336 RepID=A0ABV5HWX9_9RHOB
MGGIISFFTRHRTAANLLLILLVALGLMAAPNMRAQFFPDIVIDNVTVSVAWDGASAEDVDAGIVQLVEPALLAVEGVTEARATSRENSAAMVLEFEPGWDMGRAADEVESALDQITDLPDDAEEPVVRRGAWHDRVTDVIISGPVGAGQLARTGDEFVARLFAAGVTRATVSGVAVPETRVEVPAQALVAHDLTMADIAAAIAARVDADPAGDVTGANARLRTGTEARSPAEIAAIPLRLRPDGTALEIGDLATVQAGGLDRGLAYYVGGAPAVAVRVDRPAEGDALDVQATVEQIADGMLQNLPEGVTLDLVRTRSEAISSRLTMLLDNAATGLALVVGLLFLFLNARTAFWVAAGIPVAMLAALALMYAAGLTLNMISLFAIIITLGIVVDDAIVVGEHADARHRRLGEPPAVAAERAAGRMALPVFSATLTTLIAFFGLAIIGGRFGDLIYDIPFTVIAVLAASLVECFLILPNHMAHALARSARERWYDVPSRVVNRAFTAFRDRGFRPLIALVIRARYAVLAGAVLLLATQVASVVRGDVTWRFFNAPERGSVTGNFAMAPGATRADALAQMRAVQQAVEDLGKDYAARHGTNPVSHVLAQVGGHAGRGMAGSETRDDDLKGGISIELIDADLRPYSSFAFLADLQDRAPRLPMTEALSFRGSRSGPGGDAIDIALYGATAETLKAAAEALKTRLAQEPEVSALEDTLAWDKAELVLELTPHGQALGFDIDALGRTLRNRVSGIEAATYPDGPRSATIRVELPEADLSADFLDTTMVRGATGHYVPVADIVTVTTRTGFSTVRRENGLRLVTVTGDISGDDPARAAAITRALGDEILPRIAGEYRVEYRMGGLSEQEDDFLADARLGLMLTLLGIYLVLALVFASWARPLAVMAVIPFGLVGAIWGHAHWDVPLSMFSVVGLLGMTGIIINDSIVLVTAIDGHARGRGLLPAIIEGTADRLRAVVLTTLTTVLGLAPLLFERSTQAQFLKPTVITLVYGLGFGMVLVLILMPALLAIGRDMGRPFTALARGWRARRGGVAVLMRGTGAALALWFAATMGWVLATGALPAPLAGLVPLAPMQAALVLQAGGTAALVAMAWIGAVATTRRHRQSGLRRP